MALTGVLAADFSAFITEAKKAEQSLQGMQTGGAKTATVLNQMSTQSVAPMNTLRESFRQVDQALAASGLNINKYAAGLADIAEASGKSVGQLGLLASAGLVVSAAITGWKIGEKIGEWTGWTKAIQDGTAAMMGWGDVAGQTAAAQADVLALASQRAQREITSLSEAMKINADFVRNATIQNKDWTATLANQQREVRALSDAQIADIEIMKRAGASTKDITDKYGLSAEALKLLAERQKLAGQAADAHTKVLEQQRAAVEKLDADYAKLMSDVSNANQLAIMEADAQRMAAESLQKKNNAAAAWISQQVKVKAGIDAEAAATAAYLTEQDALTAATDALSAAHTEGGAAASQATAVAVQGYQGVAQQVQITGDAIKEWIALMKYSAQVNAILSQNSLFTTRSQQEQIAALGSPTFSGTASRGGSTVNNVINIVDTQDNLARRISDTITREVMRAGPI